MRKIALFLVATLLIVSVVLCAGCTSSSSSPSTNDVKVTPTSTAVVPTSPITLKNDDIVGVWELDFGSLGKTRYSIYNDGSCFSSSYNYNGDLEDTYEYKWSKKDGGYVITDALSVTYADLSKDGTKLILSSEGSSISVNMDRVSNTVPTEKPKVTGTPTKIYVTGVQVDKGGPSVVIKSGDVPTKLKFTGVASGTPDVTSPKLGDKVSLVINGKGEASIIAVYSDGSEKPLWSGSF